MASLAGPGSLGMCSPARWSYVVQMSPDPITDDSWEHILASTRSSCEVDGAQPGKRCWFRIAAVNSTGQGPWSMPTCRPVM